MNTFTEVLQSYNLDLVEIVEHSYSNQIEFVFSEINENQINPLKKELEEIFVFPKPFFIQCSFKHINKDNPNSEVEAEEDLTNSGSDLSEPVFSDDIPVRSSVDFEDGELISFSQEEDLFSEPPLEMDEILNEIESSPNEKSDSQNHNEENDFNLDDWKEEQLKNEKKKEKELSLKAKEATHKLLEPGQYVFGKEIKKESIPIIDVDFSNEYPEKDISLEGTIFKTETKDTKKGTIFSFYITDYTCSIVVQTFISNKKEEINKIISANLTEGKRIKVFGNIEFNEFQKEKILRARSIQILEPVKRIDTAEDKRIELHLHSQYSTLDGVAKVKDIVNRAIENNYEAIGITDHGVLQAYPEFQRLTKGTNLKVLYGVEANMVDTQSRIIIGNTDLTIDDEIVFFDLETTGTSIYKDQVIEIAAVVLKNGKITDSFQTLVNPHIPIPKKITEITGITNQDVHEGIEEDEAFEKFFEFVNNRVLVAHNATFDIGFVKRWLNKHDKPFEFTFIDSLPLARALVPEISRYNMNRLCSFFKIKNERAHRAKEDSEASAKVLVKLFDRARDKGVIKLKDLNSLIDIKTMALKNPHTNHIIVYALNQKGLYKLYQLVSDSHMKYFYKYPRIPKEILQENRENLLFGSACNKGELYEAILDGSPDEVLREIAEFYDYLEIQPVQNYSHLKRNGIKLSKEQLEDINNKIIQIGKETNKLVIATSDAHFLDPQESIFREIIKSATSKQNPSNKAPLYLRTTHEMLEEFKYLGYDLARDVVIENPKKLLEFFGDVKPIPDGTFPPVIEGADEEIRDMTYKRAHEIYGKNLPKFVEKRIKRELDSIISNGYAVLYLIAQKLVKHSEDAGFIVGSRGSVGSSFVAYLCGITEVNSLRAHYVCPNCHYTEEVKENGVIGPDLKDKTCPHCQTNLRKEGFDIPFETFLGFEGDKEPDIDLNFSGDNQAEAHRYTEELFGEGKTFRAGTISTIQEASAFGYVKNFFEEQGSDIPKAEIERLKVGCTGIKRTTGQHPGGIMVVPKSKDIFEFTPIQYPADDINSPNITTHFDYHSISGRLLKLDILGHDDPTMLRRLELLTGVNPREIPLDDKDVISLFTSTDSLNFKKKCDIKLGNFGIPEFGTSFVYQMIRDLKPKTFSDLIRVSGWSHGTDVWTGNAQQLVKSNKKVDEIISTRDDIMLTLLSKGLEPIDSFTIMEKVRKGKGLSDEDIKTMKKHNVQDWFIESCQKIQYLFPKAHAVAYVIMAFRIAWYKIHYPLAYYACFFGIRSKEFDLPIISAGMDAVNDEIKRINELSRYGKLSNKDNQSLVSLQLALEMYARGFNCLNIDLEKSHYNEFKIEDNALRPPFNTINGMGDTAAESLYNTIKNNKILSQEDLLNKSKITKTNLNTLEDLGCLKNMPKSNQISFF